MVGIYSAREATWPEADAKVNSETAICSGAGLLISRVTFRIPEIRLENIGSDTDGGVVISELSGILIQAIFMAVIEKGGDLIPGNMMKGLSAGLEGLEDLSVRAADEVGKAAEEAGQALEKTADEVGKGINEALQGIEGIFKKEETQ